MKRIVLDASAIITLFEERPGFQVMEEILSLTFAGEAELLMSAVNWGEVFYSIWRRKDASLARRTLAEAEQLPIEVVAADREMAERAAQLHLRSRLPFADGFAVALAISRCAQVATSDKDFRLIDDQVPVIWVR